jgi:hypothetical protein
MKASLRDQTMLLHALLPLHFEILKCEFATRMLASAEEVNHSRSHKYSLVSAGVVLALQMQSAHVERLSHG